MCLKTAVTRVFSPRELAGWVAVALLAGSAVSVAAVAATDGRGDANPVTKIMIVVLENTDYSAALRQPFLSSLVARGALLDGFTAEAHPSQPNYIALIAGSTYGVTSDDNVTIDGRQIGDLLESKGLQWKVYAEGYPGNCFLGSSAGAYVRKHLPFLSFKDVQADPVRCARIVNASELATDVQNGTMPSFSLYVPDLNDDGHDTGIAFADRWLASTFSPLLDDPRFARGLQFVVTFDESADTAPGGNRVATVLVGGALKPGTVIHANYNHYSLLRLVEDELGLGSLGQGDATAVLINGLQ